MATEKVKVFVHRCTYDNQLVAFSTKSGSECFIFVGQTEIDYEIPADFNPVAAQVAALHRRLEAVSDEHMKVVQRIKNTLSELQCIENKVPA